MKDKETDELLDFLIDWCDKYDYGFVLPTDDEKNIDFLNINLKTKTVYADELCIVEPLTEVG